MTEKRLTPKQVIVLNELLNSGRVSEAAIAAGVSRETIYVWMKTDKRFIQILDQYTSNAINDISNRMLFLTKKAIYTLERILDDKNSPVNARIRVAEILIEKMIRLSELANVERRLADLEGQRNEIWSSTKSN